MRNLKLLKSRLNLIVRVNVVLNRTVVVDSDWRFDNLCGSHLQSRSWPLMKGVLLARVVSCFDWALYCILFLILEWQRFLPNISMESCIILVYISTHPLSSMRSWEKIAFHSKLLNPFLVFQVLQDLSCINWRLSNTKKPMTKKTTASRMTCGSPTMLLVKRKEVFWRNLLMLIYVRRSKILF